MFVKRNVSQTLGAVERRDPTAASNERFCQETPEPRVLTVVTRVTQELDALLEGQPQRGARVAQVLEGVLHPHRLDLLLAVAVQLVEDVDEQL